MKKIVRKIGIVIIVIAMVMCSFTMTNSFTNVQAQQQSYTIYPTPQASTYSGGAFELSSNINLVFEEGIDQFTKQRATEVLELKDKTSTISNTTVDGKTNIIVGIYNSGSYVDTYFKSNNLITNETIFNNYDAYILSVQEGTISILGKDTDAAFYGLSTLKLIFKQLENNSILNLKIDDYANIGNRGFIEGYYGSPWSHEDRKDLMKFGGDYKMTNYIFAPKDDPYHNSRWRELYPSGGEELERIKELAAAGNESKCYYTYALHTFMAQPFNYNNHENDIAVVKAKFQQLLDVGVRSFAILADDAINPQPYSGMVRYINEMTEWLESKKSEYPGLSSKILFCAGEYANNGTSGQLRAYNEMNENVQFISTGDSYRTGPSVWGVVSKTYGTNYTQNITNGDSSKIQRKPFLWINWPCSDNSKNHLLMGGQEIFLEPGVNPTQYEGIVLNPMQQSEPSKVGLFLNADYAWNIWPTEQKGWKTWEDSFHFVDHGTPIPTDASNAFYELSKHMKNQNMDSRAVPIQESTDLAPKLTAFKNELANGRINKEKVAELVAEFEKLDAAVDIFRNGTQNKRIIGQMDPWLLCWDDTTETVFQVLKGLLAFEEGDNALAWDSYTKAQVAFENSKTHKIWYLDHWQYAEVGVQHIVPFMKALLGDLGTKSQSILDPTKVIAQVITNRIDTPTGELKNILDNNTNTEVIYKTPNTINKDTYIGIKYNKVIKINQVTFAMGTKNNATDTFATAKMQYTEDGTNWKDITGTSFVGNEDIITVDGLDLNAIGIRLIATTNKTGTWFGCRDILVNEELKNQPVTKTAIYSSDKLSIQANSIDKIIDDNNTSYVHLAKGPYQNPNRDTIPVDAWVGVQFNKPVTLQQIEVLQDAGDYSKESVLEYSEDGTTWHALQNYTNTANITYNGQITAKKIRLRNKVEAPTWWKVFEIKVTQQGAVQQSIIRTQHFTLAQGTTESNLIDGNDATIVWYDTGTDDVTRVGDFIGMDLGKVTNVGKVRVVVGAGDGDKWQNYHLEYSKDNVNWETYKSYQGTTSGTDVIDENLRGKEARYVRLVNDKELHSWIKFGEFTVNETDKVGVTEYTYTNVDAYKKLQNDYDYNFASLNPTNNITLAPDQYIGIMFDRIRDLNEIKLDISNDTGLTLRYSMNQLEWKTVTDKKDLKEARYIQLINTSQSNKTFDISQFEVLTNELRGPQFVRSDVAIVDAYKDSDSRNKGTLGNLFDGNFSTKIEFCGAPLAGNEIVYDLSQTRNIKKIRAYIADGELNYLRDAKIQISMNGTDWNDVTSIGDGIENTDNVDDLISAGWIHDSKNPGNNYIEGTVDNVEARYLRIYFTAGYRHRFVSINEIVINDGEYIKQSNNPTFESPVIEEKGFAPENMNDGDITTGYKPSQPNSNIIYRLSNITAVKQINIVQSPSTISKAKVYGRAINNSKKSNDEWVLLGRLDSSLTTIYNPFYDHILDIKIEWEDAIPTIFEVLTFDDQSLLPDRTILQNTYDAVVLPAVYKYTKSTYEAYIDTVNTMEELLTVNNNATQNDINLSINNYNGAVASLIIRGDVSKVDDVLKSNEHTSLKEYEYQSESWSAYKDMVKKAKEMIADDSEVSTTDVTNMLTDLQTKKDALIKLSVTTIAELQQMVDNYATLKEKDYTVDSWQAYQIILIQAKKMVQDNNATVTEIQDMAFALSKARGELVASALATDKSTLDQLLKSYKEDYYTKNSWVIFKVTYDEGVIALNNPLLTETELNTIIKKVTTEASKLVTKGNIVPLISLIEELEALDSKTYTKESWQVLQEALVSAKDFIKDKDNVTASQVNDEYAKLSIAKQGLVLKPSDDNSGYPSVNPNDKGTNTGDALNINKYLVLSSIALVGVITVVIRKKKQENK